MTGCRAKALAAGGIFDQGTDQSIPDAPTAARNEDRWSILDDRTAVA